MCHRFLSILFSVSVVLFVFSCSAYCIECDSCADCSNKLADNVYLELNKSISNSSTCIINSSKDNVTIDCNGHNITDTGTGDYGIQLDTFSNVIIKNCIIIGFNEGISIENNVIGRIDGVNISESRRFGLYLDNMSNVSITDTSIINCGDAYSFGAGIYLRDSNYTNITQNYISDNKKGINLYLDSNYNMITKNIIINNNKSGIFLQSGASYPDNNTIYNNRIRNNSKNESSKYEIEIETDCTDNNISWNGLKYNVSDSGTNTIIEDNIYSDLIVGSPSYFIADHPYISNAIVAAMTDDLIHVMSGTYNECVNVDRPVTLRGENNTDTKINCSDSIDNAVFIYSDNVTVSNFYMNSTSLWTLRSQDIRNVTIKDNVIHNLYGRSIELINVEYNIISGNTICGGYGNDYAVFFREMTYTNISYNTFLCGFRLAWDSNNNNIWMNNFTDPDDSYNTIDDNYCVFGLDNVYHESNEWKDELSCLSYFMSHFNDNFIYRNDSILFYVNTSLGESNYTQINATIVISNYTKDPTDVDILTWLRFNNEGEDNETFFRDSSVYGSNGTCTPPNCSNYTNGTVMTGMVFDGVDDKVEIANPSNFDFLKNESFAVEFYMKVDHDPPNPEVIFSRIDQNDGNPNMWVSYESGYFIKFALRDSDGNYNDTIGVTAIAPDIWNYIVAQYDGEEEVIQLYVNGFLVGCTDTSYTGNFTFPLEDKPCIGAYMCGTAGENLSFSGAIDEFRIWNRTLSFSEIKKSWDYGFYIKETNYTLELESGDSIDGIYKYEFNETESLGVYNATYLHYTEADGDNGSSELFDKFFEVTELDMVTSANATVFNITQTVRFEANVTGNATNIVNVLVQIYWNESLKDEENMSEDSDAEEGIHQFFLNYDNTTRSGNYTINITVFAGKNVTNTEVFFVNYGWADVWIDDEPTLIFNATTRAQEYTVTAVGGDIANISSVLAINDTSILNITASENWIKNISYILNGNNVLLRWNITGTNEGIVEVNVTSSIGIEEAFDNKTIEVTISADTEAPNVSAVWTQYWTYNYVSESQIFNLNDTMYIYADAFDAYGVETVKANITLPGGGSQEINLSKILGTQQTYGGAFQNTTATLKYNITIIASDGFNVNDTETTDANVTDQYMLVDVYTWSNYNRGENATINIYVYGVNDNWVSDFNTTLNITYDGNTTNLLPNNLTNNYEYYIDTDVLGNHFVEANVSKYGNTGHGNTTFAVNNTYYVSFTIPDGSSLYNPSATLNTLLVLVQDIRGSSLDSVDLNVSCYNDTSRTLSDITLTYSPVFNHYIYSGGEWCHAPPAYSEAFSIYADSEDDMNNTGAVIIYLSTAAEGGGDTGSDDTSTPTPGGFMPPPNVPPPSIIYQNDTNFTRDFMFFVSSYIDIKQGEDTTLIATVDNFGDIGLNISIYFDEYDFLNIVTEKNFTIDARNKDDLYIYINVPLTTEPDTYIITFTAESGDLRKTSTTNINVMRNENLAYIDDIREKIPELKDRINEVRNSGMDIRYLEDIMNSVENSLLLTDTYINENNLFELEATVERCMSDVSFMEESLNHIAFMSWVSDKRTTIAVSVSMIIMFIYGLLCFIIPYYYLRKELKPLKLKEIELHDAKKNVQKQYFMRQIDEITYRKLLSEKHSLLLDVRSHLGHVEKKIDMLKKGKLSLKENEKYSIWHKIFKKNKVEPEDKKGKIKEDARKDKFTGVSLSDRDDVYVSEGLNENVSKKSGVISGIKDKYMKYKLHRKNKKIEKEVKKLEKEESALEDKDKVIRMKEEKINRKIDALKEEEGSENV